MLSPSGRLVWDLMLDADMNARYWGYLAKRYQKYDSRAKLFLAVAGVFAFTSWVAEVPWLSAILALLTGAVAAALPILSLTQKVERMAGLRGVWTGIHFELSRLWARVDTLDAELIDSELRQLQDRVAMVKRDDAALPHDGRLLNKCWDEVVVSMGLN